MQPEFALGLNNLLNVGEDLKGFYIGKVVDDGESDAMGRIKVKIESLFGDIKDADLPWIQMMPSCGMYVKPQKGDFVTVMFQGSVYEGFYVGHTVHMKSESKNKDGGVFGANLGKEFFLNFHNSFIKGKYDGSAFELNVNKNTTVKIDGTGNIKITNKGKTSIETTGTTDIKSTGAITLESKASVTIKGAGNAATNGFCAFPACLFTGALHTTATTT